VSARAYRAVLFDLFGTLIHFDATTLPEMMLDGRRVRATLPAWAGLLADAVPGIDVEAFGRAVAAVSDELDHERRETLIERPSRERFRRALVRIDCAPDVADEVGVLCARAHMRVIADATRFPAEHARLLADVARRRSVAVITNFDDTATAYDILGRHGILAHAGSVVVSEAMGLRKPHAALVRAALRDLDVAASDALMVGDHPVEDVGAAHAAGADAAWLDLKGTGIRPDAPVPQHVIRRLTDVASLLD
jgi:FMN phosphatase YigB (HAD superfamily)